MSDKIKTTGKDYDIIKYPLMTEKSTMILEKANGYVFIVEKTATKSDIKSAVEKIFNVKVLSVNTIINKGKNKSFRGISGKRSDFKKAIIRLESGNKIELGVGV